MALSRADLFRISLQAFHDAARVDVGQMCGAHGVRVVQERGGEKGRERRGGQGRTEEEKDTSSPKEVRCQISCFDHTLEGDVCLISTIKFAWNDAVQGVGMVVYLVHSLSQRLKLDVSVDDPQARTRTQSE